MNDEDITKFAESLRGEVIRTGDASYDEARKLYNGMIDKRPLIIARCVDVALRAARAYPRRTGVRIDAHAVHRRQVDHQTVVAAP